MWDHQLTQVELWGKVKRFPKLVCERAQIDNLNVDVIQTRGEKGQMI